MRARTYLLRMLELVKMVVTARSRSEACFRCVVALRYVQMVQPGGAKSMENDG
jgi:hypothetical protein